MSNLILNLLGQGVAAGVVFAEADKADLLAKANAAGVSLENIGEKYVDAAIEGVSLPAPFSFFPKPIVVQAVNNGIAALVAAGQSKESVLFDMLMAWANAGAKQLESA